jgi:hypothetical protein
MWLANRSRKPSVKELLFQVMKDVTDVRLRKQHIGWYET